jgi:Ca2+-transporting ATPase
MTQGLSQTQAQEQLAAQGPNELPTQGQRGWWRLVLDVVTEPMLLLLVACGGIYMALGDRQEALMLMGFVVVVMGISLAQQRRTERSLEALRDLSSPRALVIRDGQPCRIAGRELVLGDIVLLAEGDRVPADLDLLESANLAVDESLLTGESLPVDKPSGQVFSGTLVTRGTAQGRVVATGERSALGRIGHSLQGLAVETTPIQQETNRIVRRVAVLGLLVASGLALALGLQSGDWLHGLLAGLTLAMGILPEELPVVLTLFLGLGAWRLSKEHVLARSIPAVELLGATTVLCVDKTGTLTANRMAVRRLWNDEAVHDAIEHAATPLPEALHALLEFAVLASHRRAFDPMETAISQAGQALLANTEHLHADWSLVDDYPLSPDLLAMSRVWQSPDRSERMIAAKGAPEAVVDLCHLDATRSAAIAAQVAAMARDGLRVLGVARATFAAAALPDHQHAFDFEFLGLLALQDPVRPEVPAAIAQCQLAGIRVVMITGDHPATAASIARQAGLPEQGEPLTGVELATLSDEALAERLGQVNVFCRVQPDQKLRLVQAFRARGDVVAMTGDGVNDAPALKAAHIGVAMGGRGTDVAREAAALVLINDDFSSIVKAVSYGRRVFANLRKAIAFVVGVHIPIIGLSLLPVALGWPMVLMPVHILFLQLIIDPACSIVFEAEPLEADAMSRPPRRPDARLFDATVLKRGLWQGAGLLVLLLAVYEGVLRMQGSHDMARALTFMVLVLSNLTLILSNRSWQMPVWRQALAGNRPLRWAVLGTLVLLVAVLGVPQLGALFAFALPTGPMLLTGVAVAVLGLLWFEAVKKVQSC